MRPIWMCTQYLMMIFSSFHLLVIMDTLISSSFAKESLCHDDDSSALLQLKQSFLIDESAPGNPPPPPNHSKIRTWEPKGGEKGLDCCKWDGVECDVGTGHVIGLDLSSSLLSGSLDPASTLFSLVQLRRLNLAYNRFNHSRIPSEISNLSFLSALNLSASDFSGMIPASLGELTELTLLDLSQNHFEGQIPSWISELKKLEFLDLSYNNFNGSVHADIFLNLKNLSQLRLSDNSISLLTNNTMKTSLPVFRYLGLDSCNLSEFPEFLRFQEKLEIITLVNNRIQQIPGWMRNGNNRTTRGSDKDDHLVVLPWPSLRIFDLRDNMLEGSLPIPPPNITGYLVSNSRLTGEISPEFCRLNLLSLLDLSNNSMSGTIPPCLTSLSDSLAILNLKSNMFSGTIPHAYTNGCRLRQVDLSQNRLTGSLPHSLTNCKDLEILILAQNQLHDKFPIWLAVLPSLQVLILRSNNFYGEIRSPSIDSEFPKIRIIDLSNNSFTGNLPLESPRSWNAMKTTYTPGQTYITSTGAVRVQDTTWRKSYEFSMTMTDKGVRREYQKIYNIFTAIDLSGNNLGGEIPESIGNLQGLQVLNLYNNQLTGGIPASMGNLTQLESLDISQNKLSGNIPQQMRELTKLSFFNVSCNRLVGPIPQGTQFSTFENNSYMDNLALCGYPLSRKCGNQLPEASQNFQPPAGDEDDNSDQFPTGVDWAVILSGVLGGLPVGLILGRKLTMMYREWFDEKVGNIYMSRKRETSSVLQILVATIKV